MSRVHTTFAGALGVATLLASTFAGAQQKLAAPAPAPTPPQGSVVAPATTSTSTPERATEAAPEAHPEGEVSQMPAINFAPLGSAGGAWLARVSDSSDNNTSFALGMNNNAWGASVGVGMMPNARRSFGVMVRGRYVVGQTSLDLASHFASIGAEMPIAMTPNLSIVPTLRGDWLLLVRASQGSAPDIQHWGYGAGLGLDYTFLRFSELTFFARPEISGTITPHAVFEPRSGLLNGVLMIGVRYLPD